MASAALGSSDDFWHGPTVAVPRMILTADDFGRSPEVNAAVVRWAQAGALTQASLMVNESYAAEAVALAAGLPGLRVGLHLTLCDGLGSDGGGLPRSPGWAGLRYAFWPGARAFLRREIAAQFRRFAEFGLPPTYWDGHTHLHLHPVVMNVTLPIARQHGFRFTRLVREPGRPALLPWIFRRLSERAAPKLRGAGIEFTDHVFGLRNTGRMTQSEFMRGLEWSARGSVEVYFHPGAETTLPAPEWVADAVARIDRAPEPR